MKIAYTGWMWLREFAGNRDAIRRTFEQSVRELTHLGYRHIENMASFLVPYFDDPQDVSRICENYGASFAALYSNLEEGWEKLTSYVDFVAGAGASYLIAMSPNWAPGRDMGDRPVDWDGIRAQAELANRVGAYAAAHGVTFCYNPHAYTDVATAEEFAFFAGLTDPDTVKFCLDCGHATLAGVDPLEQLETYYGRVAYIHIKDVDPTVEKKAPLFGRLSFVPLGFGTVNVKGYLKALQAHGYEGYVCVGMPPPCAEINDYESAAISRAYLKLNCHL